MATKAIHPPITLSFSSTQIAIACKLVAIILYAVNNVLSKQITTQLTTNISVETMIFYQYCFACLWLIPYGYVQESSWTIPKQWHLHLGRMCCCCVGLILLHDAFRHMPLAQAVGFNIFSPCITLIGACVLLKEKITPTKLGVLAMSIMGYLCLLNPQSQNTTDITSWQLLQPSIAILCFQANTFLTKMLTSKNENHFYLNASIILSIPVCLLPYMIYTTQQSQPILETFFWLFCMGSNDFFAMLALNYAIAQADVSFLLPLGFSKYTLISILGFCFFGEILTTYQVMGLILGLISVWLLQKYR